MYDSKARQSGLLLITALLIIAMTGLLYYPILNGEFVWDDFMYLSNNPHIQQINWENLKWMLTTLHLANWHPLTWLSFSLDYFWQGELSPWGFHLTNIILHGLNSVGLFFLTILLLNIAQYGLSAASLRPYHLSIFVAAIIAAVLFSFHPQHVESVAWIAERKDVLSLFFFLLTLILYVFYTKTADWRYYLAACIIFLLAIMAKPMVVTLPVLLLLLDIYPLQRTALLKPNDAEGSTVTWYQLLIEKIPFFAIALLSIVLTLFAQRGAMVPLEFITLFIRTINAINSVFLYISKWLLPISLSPLYIYPDYVMSAQDWLKIITLLGGFTFATSLSIYYWFKHKPYFLIAWLFYLVAVSPVIGIIQTGVQSAADRYAYLPTIPFYILISAGIVDLYFKPRQHFKTALKSLLAAAVVIVCLMLFKLNRDQLQIWQNNIFFWSYIVQVSPTNAMAHHNLAVHYFSDRNYEKALEHALTSIHFGYYAKLGQSFLAENFIWLGRFDEAIIAYQNALELNMEPKLRKDCVYYNIGLIYTKKGQFTEAHPAFEQVKAGSPEYGNAQGLMKLLEMLDNKTLEQSKFDELLNQLTPCFSSSDVNSELVSPP